MAKLAVPSAVDNETIENGKHNNHSNKQQSVLKRKEFPRINDLLTQHATQQKLNEKISKQKSINDALPPTIKQQYEKVCIGTLFHSKLNGTETYCRYIRSCSRTWYARIFVLRTIMPWIQMIVVN